MFYLPKLNRPYSDTDMESIFTDALKILSSLGIACTEPRTVERVTSTAGITSQDGRLYFEPDTIRQFASDVRKANLSTPAAAPPEFEVMPAWCCLNYADPQTNQVRPPTTKDAVQMTRLMHAFGGHDWAIPLVPADVDPRHATITAEFIALSNSASLGGYMPAMDSDEIEFLIEMNQAVGRKYMLDEQIGISPLKFNDHGLASALNFLDRDDVTVILVGSIPATGSTAPFNAGAALAMALAEGLALGITCDRLGLGKGLGIPRVYPFDLQHMTIGFGCVEENLHAALHMQLSEYVTGRTNYYGNLHSMSPQADTQAIAERSMGAVFQALLGRRIFRGGGQLCVDEVFSPLQLIYDIEILRHVKRITEGLDPLAKSDDIIAEIRCGIESGSFIAEEETVNNFRDFCLFPELFSHCNLGHWQKTSSPSIEERAWSEAEKLIDSCDFHLSDDQAKQLQKIYDKAKQAIK